MEDIISDRLRKLETQEPPVVVDAVAAAVSSPPTQLECDGAFGATAATFTEGWTGVIYDAGAGNTWICTSAAGQWWVTGGSGGGAGAPHTILSATHTDTLASAVSRGSLIYGNATPAWAELALGGITGSLVTRNATDVLWSSYALSGTAGQTYTFPANTGSVPTGAGTCTVATANDATIVNHTHAITTSANPGAAASILASTAAGGLTLQTLTLAGATLAFTAGSGSNLVTVPDSLVSALNFQDASANSYYTIDTDSVRNVFNQNVSYNEVCQTNHGTWTFAAASGSNLIGVVDNYADALHISDTGGTEYVKFVSTNAQPGFHVNDGGADVDTIIESVGKPNALWVRGSDGYVGINDTTLAAALSIVSGTANYPCLRITDVITNTTNKVGLILGAHYLAAEEDVLGFWFSNISTGGRLVFGGGSGLYNSVNSIFFYTGNGSAVLTGTLRMYIDGTGQVGIGTGTSPDRLFHTETADNGTTSIIYNERSSHLTSGTAAPLFGVGKEFELEDSAGNPQVASEVVTLWSVATSGSESPLLRFATYPKGAVKGYSGMWSYSGISGAVTVIANGTGDVAEVVTFVYAVSAVTAGDAAGGTCTLEPSDSFVLYNDGAGDTLTLAVAADGSVTVTEAGGDTFDCTLWGVWH